MQSSFLFIPSLFHFSAATLTGTQDCCKEARVTTKQYIHTHFVRCIHFGAHDVFNSHPNLVLAFVHAIMFLFTPLARPWPPTSDRSLSLMITTAHREGSLQYPPLPTCVFLGSAAIRSFFSLSAAEALVVVCSAVGTESVMMDLFV